jgi:hypothetical protein
VFAREIDRFDSVTCVRNHFEPCVLEHEAQVGADDRIVVDGENAGCREGWQMEPPCS